MPKYFGEYADFETVSKKDAAILLGPDNMVGDIYDIDIELENGIHKAWLVSRFEQRIGFLDADLSRKLSLYQAEDMTCKAILSFVAFTSVPDEGHYWGQVGLVCYSPAYEEEFSLFIKGVSEKIAEDVRPRLDFDNDGIEKIIDSNGEWIPAQTIKLPDTNKQMSIIKRRRKITDRLIEQGRSGNKGCYVVSWVFLLVIVALLIYALKGCMGW